MSKLFTDTFILWDGSFDWFSLMLITTIVILTVFATYQTLLLLINYFGFATVKEQRVPAKITKKYQSLTDPQLVYISQDETPVITSKNSDDIYSVEVKLDNDLKTKAKIDKSYFEETEIGDRVIVSFKILRWTKALKVTGIYPTGNL